MRKRNGIVNSRNWPLRETRLKSIAYQSQRLQLIAVTDLLIDKFIRRVIHVALYTQLILQIVNLLLILIIGIGFNSEHHSFTMMKRISARDDLTGDREFRDWENILFQIRVRLANTS